MYTILSARLNVDYVLTKFENVYHTGRDMSFRLFFPKFYHQPAAYWAKQIKAKLIYHFTYNDTPLMSKLTWIKLNQETLNTINPFVSDYKGLTVCKLPSHRVHSAWALLLKEN